MSVKEQLIQNNLPSHVAIIMDGNGRWAKKRGLARLFGHRKGVASVRHTIEAAAELHIKYLTLYVFSSENWNRPQEEVLGLMNLLVESIEKETASLIKNNIKLQTIGDTSRFNASVKNKLDSCILETSKCTGLTVVLALSYSGQWDILNAVSKIIEDAKGGKIDSIDKDSFATYLSTKNIPNPELMIRTSGECRISNFLLWELAYSELYFTDINWPDFTEEEFYKALLHYQGRERRFGKTSEQV